MNGVVRGDEYPREEVHLNQHERVHERIGPLNGVVEQKRQHTHPATDNRQADENSLGADLNRLYVNR